MPEIFESSDYKTYLIARLGPPGTRTGERRRLAEALGCQTAYVSQVLNGPTHFSLEQAYRVNEFLGHDPSQSKMFMLLVSRDRAGTKDLERYYQTQMNELVAEKMTIRGRIQYNEELSPEDQSRYFSSWQYVAVHQALALPILRNPQAIAAHLALPLPIVHEILEYLQRSGLAVFKEGEYRVGPRHIHLPHDSPFIHQHHLNWRMRAIDSLTQKAETDLHYSVLYTVSREDAVRLKKCFLDLIRDNLKIIEPSPEEAIYCNTLDFFELKR